MRQISQIPTESEARNAVDQFITAEASDKDAQAFCHLILTVANPEDERSWDLANAAARHAFSKTQAYEDAFKRFAGFPVDEAEYSSNKYMVEVGREQ